MRLLGKLVGVLIVLLALALVFVWVAIPLNVPWRSLFQQAGALPAWLDPPPMSAEQVQGRLTVPEGYGVSLFATGIPDVRMLRVTAVGDVLVSTPRDGQVILLEADRNGDGMSDGQRVLLEGLTRPNGLELAGGYLYVAEEDGIGRIAFNPQVGAVNGSYQRIIDGLPRGGNHWKKTIRMGPDGLLYVSVGSSCNVCVENDPRRAALLRYTADGDFVDVFASGLRNSAGFDWVPGSGTLYATDNGRDLLGDDFPPCELNMIIEGGFYGWPFANGSRVPDPDFGGDQQEAIKTSLPPAYEFRAHNAPLGIVFLRHERHLPGYRGAAVVALHGSWNRTKKDGYKVVTLHPGPDGTFEEREFLTGFLVDDVAIGRPTEVAEGPDGSIYVSDDFGSAVYQIRYGNQDPVLFVASTEERSVGYNLATVSDEERVAALSMGSSLLASEGCLACHGEIAVGDQAQVVLDDLRARYTVDELGEYLLRPTAPMPPYDVPQAARRALAIYLLETY